MEVKNVSAWKVVLLLLIVGCSSKHINGSKRDFVNGCIIGASAALAGSPVNPLEIGKGCESVFKKYDESDEVKKYLDEIRLRSKSISI